MHVYASHVSKMPSERNSQLFLAKIHQALCVEICRLEQRSYDWPSLQRLPIQGIQAFSVGAILEVQMVIAVADGSSQSA